jgi:RNA polymerase sigma-70 factor, ECF subfamily
MLGTRLAELFLPAVAPGRDAPDRDRLESVLASCLEAARAAWPGVVQEPARFLPYLAARLPDGMSVEDGLGALRVTDLYLACACASAHGPALAAFEASCMGVVDVALARMDLPRDAVDEVKQIVRRLLLVADGRQPRIVEYAGRGDLRGWIRVTAAREALRLIRRSRTEVPVEADELERSVPTTDDPALQYLKDVYRAEFKAAFGEAMASLSDRERNLLGHQFVDGLTLDEIAVLYRVHRATIARWIARARAHVLRRTQAALRTRLRVEPAQMESIMRLIESRLDVSLPPLLRPTDDAT